MFPSHFNHHLLTPRNVNVPACWKKMGVPFINACICIYTFKDIICALEVLLSIIYCTVAYCVPVKKIRTAILFSGKRLFVYSICVTRPVSGSVHLFLFKFCLSVRLSVHLSIGLSVWTTIGLSVSLSIC